MRKHIDKLLKNNCEQCARGYGSRKTGCPHHAILVEVYFGRDYIIPERTIEFMGSGKKCSNFEEVLDKPDVVW